MTDGTAFSRLADRIHFMETTMSLEALKQMARDQGVSTEGTKRDIQRKYDPKDIMRMEDG